MSRSLVPFVLPLLILTACAPLAIPERSEQPATKPDVTTGADDTAPVAHALTARVDPGAHTITVSDVITLPESLQRSGAQFTLGSNLSISKSTPAVEVRERDDAEGKTRYALTSDPTDGMLHVEYTGAFAFSLGDQKEEYARGFRETRGTIGAEGIYLDGGSAWVPTFGDRMVGFTVEVDAPDGWHVISQGNGTSGNDDGNARWESGGLLEQIYLVGGPMLRFSDAAGAVEILAYLHEPDEALARKYLDATARYIEMYRGLIGPYPYEKFALVENFWETGYGMPSFTLLGPQVIRFPFILHSSYPHEILHNWWGNSVFVDYDSGNWCEGLTAYMADHLIQEQRGGGVEYRRSTLQKYRDHVKEGRDFPLTEFRSRHSAATEAIGYGKALMMFHMLRRDHGDDAFRTALARFYRSERGQRASFDDLRAAFESTVDADLASFFAQWVERTGAPELELSNVTAERDGDGFVVRGVIAQRQSGRPYALDVPVAVTTEAGTTMTLVESDAARVAFDVHSTQPPLAVAVDPMFDLFRLLDPRETPPSIGQIFGEPNVLAVLPSDVDSPAQRERYRELALSWSTEDHEVEIALDTEIDALPSDRAVWIYGPANRFAPVVLEGLAGAAVDQGSVTLDSETLPFDEHCFVVIARHPQSVERAIGWITVDAPEAFAGMSRKLPHYGKYSYLAFEGDEPTNTVKGAWDAGASPLVAVLEPGASLGAAPEVRQALAELPPVFSQRRMMEHVTWLAAPERGGRVPGSPGIAASAEYIAQHMASAGLMPGADDGTWFQSFTLEHGPEGDPVECRNVIGLLPGANDAWSDQSIVLGAHFDHLGLGWPDVHSGDEGDIHVGADDNASGVAVMLELAANLVAEGRPARTLVFVAFSAEEAGRVGSKHYVEHPRLPREQIRGMVNLDTVGRLFDGKIAVHGTGTTDEWPHIFRGCGFTTGIPNQIVPGAADGSDQQSFIERGVPGVQIFTGAHGDYHRPTDTVDKIDGAGLVKVATYVKEALVYLVEREEPMTNRIEGQTQQPAAANTGPRSGRRVSFGTVPEFEYEGEGVKIASLVPDSPADKAGLQAGDVLVELNDIEIADLRAFSEALKTLEPGQEITAVVMRGTERLTKQVTVVAR